MKRRSNDIARPAPRFEAGEAIDADNKFLVLHQHLPAAVAASCRGDILIHIVCESCRREASGPPDASHAAPTGVSR